MSPFFIDSIDAPVSLGALALGSFDGAHLGHQKLFEAVREASFKSGKPSAVLSFSPHPKSFFSSPKVPFLKVHSMEQNTIQIKRLGVDEVFFKKFDQICSEMTAAEFLNYVFSKLKFEKLVVGFDFRLGKSRNGGIEDLKLWCHEKSIELIVVPRFSIGADKISSTRLKKALLCGDLKEAAACLGRPYSTVGTVYADQGLGEKIGFPTLNLRLDLNTAISYGVYSSTLHFNGKKHHGLSNVGVRPTVSKGQRFLVLETHLLDFEGLELRSGDLVEVEFTSYIRPEKKFANIEELKSQIALDVARVKALKS